MKELQKENLRWKLPDLVYSLIKDGRKDEVLSSLYINESSLIGLLAAEWFPSEEQLKDFCNHFKLRFSTIKTWNVLHLYPEENG